MEVLELLSTHKNIHHVLLQNYPGLAHSRSFSQPLASARHSNSGLPIDAAALSPTNPERSRERLKNRQIRNEQAFLSWLKEDENPHRSKDERGVLVSRIQIYSSISANQSVFSFRIAVSQRPPT